MTEYYTEHVIVDDKTLANGDPLDVIDPAWWTIDIYNGPGEYELSAKKFSRPQRLMNALLWYQAEVNNGGHDQFYFNSTGIVWKDALEGLQELELEQFSAVLAESARRMGGAPPQDREARQEALMSLEPDFEDLDERFYALGRTQDLDTQIMEYMRLNRDAFSFDGPVRKLRARSP